MTRRQAWFLLALALGLSGLGCRSTPQRTNSAAATARIVSLSPAITETLFAIGGGADLVGISDYTDYPSEAEQLPHVGTAITPHYEAIVRLSPTLILSERAVNAPRRELEALGPTESLPWLSLADISASVRRLGSLTGHAESANALAARLAHRLGVSERPDGPRVLLVLGYAAGKLDEVWFIRRNSLHGAALRAAGGRNAVAEDVPGTPRLSIQRLLELDPELIVVLTAPARGPLDRSAYLRDFQALTPLSAVRSGRISVLDAPEAFANGPRILEFTDRLERELARLQAQNPAARP